MNKTKENDELKRRANALCIIKKNNEKRNNRINEIKIIEKNKHFHKYLLMLNAYIGSVQCDQQMTNRF